jgi:hypothetical protein
VAADIPALAALIGCDADPLANTLAAVATGKPDAFGRSFKRALSAPYYAVKVTGTLFHTQGGLDIDADHDAHKLLSCFMWVLFGKHRSALAPTRAP